jgi:hypothetical protein
MSTGGVAVAGTAVTGTVACIGAESVPAWGAQAANRRAIRITDSKLTLTTAGRVEGMLVFVSISRIYNRKFLRED